jgi:hypothetical protein
MKIFFFKFLILFVYIIGVKLCLDGIPLPLPEYSYNFSIIDKHRLLANTNSPKIVLAGGSNLAFGIDSAAIHDSFHVPVVNMGVHAGFGLGRILDNISPFLQAGDILLIIPEYEHFISMWNGDSEAYLLIFDFRQFRLSWSLNYGLPNGLSRYFSEHSRSLPDIISSYKKNNNPQEPNPEAYSRYGFNEYGDYIKHLGMENKNIDHDIAPIIDGVYNKSYSKNFFYIIDAFDRRGITVALSYPCLEEQSFNNYSALIHKLDALFRTKENLRVISTPESYCFPLDHFFDTKYHLNEQGRNKRTSYLIRDLFASGTFTQHEEYQKGIN